MKETLQFNCHNNSIITGFLYRVSLKTLTVISCSPYRNDGYHKSISEWFGNLLNKHNFNYLAVDIRGTGQSSGLSTDEYTFDEMIDTVNICKSISTYSWSDGRVVLMGISYSAFNALQACKMIGATSGLPCLVSAIVIHGTDDGYLTDVHYWGKVKTLSDWMEYATAMNVQNKCPPKAESILES